MYLNQVLGAWHIQHEFLTETITSLLPHHKCICVLRTEATTCLLQIVTLRGCEERVGDQRDTKVAP